VTHVRYPEAEPFDFRGLTIRELTPKGLDTASFAQIEVPPGASHQTARSIRSDKVYYCTHGTVLFRVAGRAIKLDTGDLLLIPKGDWFSYRNDSSQTSRLFLVHIPPFDLEHEEFQDE
jgi:mannose-6-phosphate isomerase-like protein (cupin superfamily)